MSSRMVYFSRGADYVAESLHATGFLSRLKGRFLGRKPEYRLLFSERIVEVPFIWRWIIATGPGARILEVGCVGSEFPYSLTAMGRTMTGIDIRDFQECPDGFIFHKGSASSMQQFSSGSFDLVFCVSVLEHVGLAAYGGQADSTLGRAMVAEMLRVLAPQGTLAVTVPFGKAVEYADYKVYNMDQLKSIFPRIRTVELYKKNGRFGMWRPASVVECENVIYEAPNAVYPVECVACIEAEKPE